MTKFKVGDKVVPLTKTVNSTTGEEIIDHLKRSVCWRDALLSNQKYLYVNKICNSELGIYACYNEKGLSGDLFREADLVPYEQKLTKKERIAALENEVAELKLIVQELRNQPKVENIINTVEGVKPPEVRSEQTCNFMTAKEGAELGESISKGLVDGLNGVLEFEGQQYRKVDREAREGDVVIMTKLELSSFEVGKPYKVLKGSRIESENKKHRGNVYTVYNNPYRTIENVKVYELVEHKILTPNQQRVAIIEKAKKFVDDLKDKEGKYSKPATFGDRKLRFEFVVNPEKRTVVALGRLFYYPSIRTIYAKGIAKCNPSDVFNEHIGKAIALGRALGLDVSEFEQAVQPKEIVIGMKIESRKDWSESANGPIYIGDVFTVVKGDNPNKKECMLNSSVACNSKIINDTNAIYE